MKSNSELRAAARGQLGGSIFKENWLYAVLICLVIGAIESVIARIAGFGDITLIQGADGSHIDVSTGSVIAEMLVLGPLGVGAAYIFTKQVRDGQKMNLSNLFYGFKTDFGGTFLLGLMESIFLTLWTLLLIVPGFIKLYSYAMAKYIKADHPEYGWKQCIDESRAMMNGYKAKLFFLDVSFIGWYLVGALALGVGVLWVGAYHSAARAQFYTDLCAQQTVARIEQ